MAASTTRPLEGKVALVTGAGRGIGRAHATLLAELGASVVVNDLGTSTFGVGSDVGPSETVAAEIDKAGGSAVADSNDVSSFAGAAAAVQRAVDAFGTVDIVINNAGIVPSGSLEDIEEAALVGLLSVHFVGAVGTARAAFPYMAARGGGRIVNTVSEVAFQLRKRGGGGYGAAKAAVWSATLWMAAEGEPHGVTANALSPAAFTRMNAEILAPLGGPRPELDLDARHVARVAAWLVSDEAADVTGRVIHVAGTHLREYQVHRLAETPLVARAAAAVGAYA